MENFNKEDKYYRAKEKVREIKKFYGSLLTYAVVISALAALNYYTNHWSHVWVIWPALFWGVGLVFQANKAFSIISVFSKDWEEKKIKEYMKDDKQYPKWE